MKTTTKEKLELQPKNINQIKPTNYVFTIRDIPHVTYFCQSANIPGMYIEEISQNTTQSPISQPGNVLEYEMFQITFLVDEELKGWYEIWRWMIGIGFPNSHNQAKLFAKHEDIFSEGTLMITTNAKNPLAKVVLHRMWPTYISPLQFSTVTQNIEPMYATVQFGYTTIDFNLL